MTELSVDVVIPVFNNWELTRGCLEHLRQQTKSHSVIVTDNASTDRTPEKVRSEFPEVQLVELDANHGFAAACNCGVEAGHSDAVVLLNNDVECPPDFLERLVCPFVDERVGSVASVLVQPGAATIDSVGLTADRTLAGFPRLRGYPLGQAHRPEPTLTGPAGAAGAYRRTAWDQVGGLDEAVFMYGEDLDLALRLRTVGWTTAVAEDAVAVHLGSASIEHRSSRQRFHGGFARGYLLRRYGVLRSRAAVRALATEAIVVVGDAVISHDLAALRGRAVGWRAGRGRPRLRQPPGCALGQEIGFAESLRLRRTVYSK